jgi:hypothetical protein
MKKGIVFTLRMHEKETFIQAAASLQKYMERTVQHGKNKDEINADNT